jgi:hypothetical protein
MRFVRFVSAAAVGGLGLVLATAAHAQAAKPPAVSHTVEGRAQCLMCHKTGVMEAVPDAPASHVDRPNEACLWCHAADAAIQTKEAKAITHSLEGKAQCMMCHSGKLEGMPAAPEDHSDRDVKYCTLCHTPPA